MSTVLTAADLVAAKTTRQPVETVEAILTAHENGTLSIASPPPSGCTTAR